MEVLLIDNHDSFTYNLVQILKESGVRPVVKLCEDTTPDEAVKYRKILISPGPGIPDQRLKSLIKVILWHSSVFGVCLGLQAIVEVFGGRLKPASTIYHGEAVNTRIKRENILFEGVPENFLTGRYHSWVADPDFFPKELIIIAEDINHEIMGIEHNKLSIHAVQFHPESILTEYGERIIKNWLKI